MVVDTDVFSLIIRDDPISAWYARRIETESRYLSFCSFGELLFGIVRLPESRRKADLAERMEYDRARDDSSVNSASEAAPLEP